MILVRRQTASQEKLNCWIKYESRVFFLCSSPFNYDVFSFLSPGDEKPWCILWCQQKKYHKHKEKELIDIWWWMLLLFRITFNRCTKNESGKVIKVVFVIATMDTLCMHVQEAFCSDNNPEENNFLFFGNRRINMLKNE